MAVSRGLEAGDRVPDVQAPLVTPAGDVREWRLSSATEDGPVLLCFYGSDFPAEILNGWSGFHELQWFAGTDHVEVVGISKSNPWVHKRFVDRLDLQIPLCSDRNLDVADSFGVTEVVYGTFSRPGHACFLVDTDRTIEYSWIADHPGGSGCGTQPIRRAFEVIRERFGPPEVETFGFDRSIE